MDTSEAVPNMTKIHLFISDILLPMFKIYDKNGHRGYILTQIQGVSNMRGSIIYGR